MATSHDVAVGTNDAGHVAICVCGWRRTSPTFTDKLAIAIGEHIAGLDKPTELDDLAGLVEEIHNGTCPFCEHSTTDEPSIYVALKMLDHIATEHGSNTINRT